MRIEHYFRILLISMFLVAAGIGSVRAEEDKQKDQNRIDVLNQDVDNSGLTTGSILRDSEMLSYCINISDIASEARSSILKNKLKLIEDDVDGKLKTLSEKIEELKLWTKKREEFLNNVNDSLVEIFESMRPDAAALQFAEMGPTVSSAIILKLDPKKSSAILTEMTPEDAAKVAIILSSAQEVKNDKNK